MQLKLPKNSDKYFWTTHSVYKMQQYGLSEQKIRSVIRSPYRKEEGIVKNTIAVMQPVNPKMDGKKKIWKQEIWVMFQTSRAGNSKFKITNFKQIPNSKIQKEKSNKLINLIPKKLKIISAWRYPGVSPERNPIPEEIIRELENLK